MPVPELNRGRTERRGDFHRTVFLNYPTVDDLIARTAPSRLKRKLWKTFEAGPPLP